MTTWTPDRITVENWMGHERATLDLRDQLTLILGEHGSGKTSLARDALQFAVTGMCRNVPLKKDLGMAVVRTGSKVAHVTVSFTEPGGGTMQVKRSVKTTGSQKLVVTGMDGTETPGSLKEVEAELLEVLNLRATAASARVVFETNHFWTLDMATRAAVVYGALASGTTASDVADAVWDALGGDDSEWRKEPGAEAYVNEIAAVAATDGFERGLKEASRLRAEQSGVVTALNTYDGTSAPAEPHDELQRQEAELEAQLTAAAESTGAQRQSLLTELSGVEQGIATLAKGKDEIEDVEPLEAALKEAEDALGLDPPAEQSQVDGPKSPEPPAECPMRPGFECPADAGTWGEAFTASEEAREASMRWQRLQSEVRAADTRLKRARERNVAVVEAAQRVDELEKTRDELKAKIEAIADTSQADEAREALGVVRDKLRQHAAAADAARRNDEQKERHAEAERLYRFRCAVADAMKPEAVRRALIKSSIPEFSAAANRFLQPSGVGSLIMDEGFRVTIARDDIGSAIPEQLSEGQRYAVAIALQAAFVECSNLRVLLVDELGMFNRVMRPRVMEALLAVGQVTPVVAMAVLNVENPTRPPVDGIGARLISDDGKVEELQ